MLPTPRLWKVPSAVFAIAVVLNYPWEMLQAPLYVMEPGETPMWLHCLVSSFGDGLLLLLILGLGWAVFGRLDWFPRAGARGYLMIAGAVSSSASGLNGSPSMCSKSGATARRCRCCQRYALG